MGELEGVSAQQVGGNEGVGKRKEEGRGMEEDKGLTKIKVPPGLSLVTSTAELLFANSCHRALQPQREGVDNRVTGLTRSLSPQPPLNAGLLGAGEWAGVLPRAGLWATGARGVVHRPRNRRTELS